MGSHRLHRPEENAGPLKDESATALPFNINAAGNQAITRAVGNGAFPTVVQRSTVCEPGDVLLEMVPVSPPQVRVLGVYSDDEIATELYGKPGVPLKFLSTDTVAIESYSTLLPKWKTVFRDTATPWERNESDRLEKIGRKDEDGKTVWRDRPVWTPITDSRRGGLVVGFQRSSGGYTEVRNTAGDIVYADELPLEPVRIPLVDDLIDVLKQAGYVAVGLVDAWLEDNWRALGLPPHEAPLGTWFGIPPDAVAYRVGRGAGHAVALLQAAAEMVGGAALIAGGSGEFLVGVATTPAGGAGLVIMPVAVATVATGATIVVHGGSLAGAVFMSAMSGDGGGGGGGGGRKGRKGDLKQVDDVAREHKMTKQQREEFGEFIEAEKASGNGGTANSRGDFTYQELRRKAAEFLELFQ